MIKFPKGLTLFINNILQITRIKNKKTKTKTKTKKETNKLILHIFNLNNYK
jgi:hypothetical protein